ncbi:hypothetical protein GCM10027026_18790 [Myroides odoratimimus subsp. xuanwuensis]
MDVDQHVSGAGDRLGGVLDDDVGGTGESDYLGCSHGGEPNHGAPPGALGAVHDGHWAGRWALR